MNHLIWSRTCYEIVEGNSKKFSNILNFPPIFPARSALLKSKQTVKKLTIIFRSSMADNNFQLRVRKRSWGNTLPSAESNFQLRVRKDFLDRIRQSPHLRSTAENNFQLRVRRGPSHAERNFQLRVRKSDPNMPIGQRAARQTLLEKIRDRRFGQRMADNNFQLRVRRSPELTQR